jgi:2-keto-3-deoxy-L-rhamnonate aldolase RhmA
MGALGILCAFVNTLEEAERGAKACRYPPRGTRGWGPHRAADYGLDAERYTRAIDDEVLFLPIVESKEGIANIDEMFAVEGVDGIILGPVDLSFSLDAPFDFDHTGFQRAQSAALRAAKRAGKPIGTHVSAQLLDMATLRAAADRGFHLLLMGGDAPLLADACRQFMANVRQVRS